METPAPSFILRMEFWRARCAAPELPHRGGFRLPFWDFLHYISGSRPRTGWPFSVSQFSSSSQSVVTVSSAI